VSERIDKLVPELFLDGPAEYLAGAVAEKIAAVPQWAEIFGDSIDAYQRDDYGMRQLPALRIYNLSYVKEFDSWFINGDLYLDVILPASIRRSELELLPDRMCAALLQQFRRPSFFSDVEAMVPGLNELGKTFSAEKGLAFQFGQDQEQIVPMAQIRANFRVDLREWDAYLEREGRTKDDPFERTLKELRRIVSSIQAANDDGSIELEVGIDQAI